MKKGTLKIIAAVLGLSNSYVYSINAGRRQNATVTELINLSKQDRSAFAARIAKEKEATMLENQIKEIAYA